MPVGDDEEVPLVLTANGVLALLLFTPPAQLSLKMELGKHVLLPGEPLRVDLAWESQETMQVNVEGVELLVDSGSGFEAKRELNAKLGSTIGGPLTLEPDRPFYSRHVLSVTGGTIPPSRSHPFVAVFGKLGEYRVRARYFGVVSNTETVRVVEPEGDDKELYLSVVRDHPEMLTEIGLEGWVSDEAESVGSTRDLLARFGDSAYLEYAQLLMLESQRGDERPAEGARNLSVAIEPQAAETGSTDQFYVEKLLAAAEARMHDDPEGAAQLLERIEVAHPRSFAGQEAARLLRLLRARHPEKRSELDEAGTGPRSEEWRCDTPALAGTARLSVRIPSESRG